MTSPARPLQAAPVHSKNMDTEKGRETTSYIKVLVAVLEIQERRHRHGQK